ncbi:MAG: hypothetical protein SGPRY_008418, partial [Prymnesium sp.]
RQARCEAVEQLTLATDAEIVSPMHGPATNGADVVSLGLVRRLDIEGSRLNLLLALPAAVSSQAADRIRARCGSLLRELPWATDVDVLVCDYDEWITTHQF